MSTFDLNLNAADAWELADRLRYIAERIDIYGPDVVPELGEEKALVFDGVEIGTMAQPEHKGGRHE